MLDNSNSIIFFLPCHCFIFSKILFPLYLFPFFRWFIDTVGYPKTSKQNIVNGVVMTVTFFVVRILAIPHYWYIVYNVYGTKSFNNAGHMRFVLFLSCVILDSINVFWFYKMCRGVTKVISLKLDANRNEIQSKQN